MDHKATEEMLIQRYDKNSHHKKEFSSGVESVDNYLLKTAEKHEKQDLIRLSVAVDNAGAVIGYFATNAHALHFSELPERVIKDVPSHKHVPAAFIAMMGVRSDKQGKGLGKILLADALVHIASAADLIGIAVVRLDVLRCGNTGNEQRRLKLYGQMGFKSLPGDSYKMYQTIKDIRLSIAEAAAADK